MEVYYLDEWIIIALHVAGFLHRSNILILPSQFWQIKFERCWLHCSKCRIMVLLRYLAQIIKSIQTQFLVYGTKRINNLPWTITSSQGLQGPEWQSSSQKCCKQLSRLPHELPHRISFWVPHRTVCWLLPTHNTQTKYKQKCDLDYCIQKQCFQVNLNKHRRIVILKFLIRCKYLLTYHNCWTWRIHVA